MTTGRLGFGLLTALLLASAPALAQPSTTLVPQLFAFPGTLTAPPSAAAAGLGLANLWLGDEPFANPAAIASKGIVLSPVFLRVSRQDLRAHSRDYGEDSGYFDGAGGSVSYPVRGVGLSLYAWQPALRQEDEAYTHVLPAEPGTFKNSSAEREVRAGLAVSVPWRSVRFGLAAEWMRLDDSYDYVETAGSPADGSHHLDFAGDAATVRAGVRFTPHRRVQVGAALGYLPALDLSGTWQVRTLALDTTAAVALRRGSGWEGGCAAGVTVSEGLRVLGALGGRSAQSWEGLGFTAGRQIEWSVGLEYRAAPDPWTARLGIGQEQQRGVPEPRAGLVSLGLGWNFEGVIVDFAALRRSISRPGLATSYDDRLVASASIGF